MVVDAHLHLWLRSRADYGWLTPRAGVLWRDVEPQDARTELSAYAVDAAVVVQAAPTVAETRFLLDIAEAHDWLVGVVGWVDFAASDGPQTLTRLAEHPKLVGVRAMLQDLEDPDWIADPGRTPTLARCADLGLALDALVRPAQLSAVERVARRHPQLRIVIDHAGKPPIGRAGMDAWRRDMGALAALPNVWCKFSGLATETGGISNDTGIADVFASVSDLFGPKRLIWGSDWPFCTTAIDYAGWSLLTARLLSPLSPENSAAVRGGNAMQFYRLKEPVRG